MKNVSLKTKNISKLLLSSFLALLMIFSVARPVAVNAETKKSDKLKIISLDAGRKYFSVDQIKEVIDRAKQDDYTHLQLILGNDGLRFLLNDMTIKLPSGETYESSRVKEEIVKGNIEYITSDGKSKKHYELDKFDDSDEHGRTLEEPDMDDILKHAKEKGIKIIPVINSPGHMDAILYAIQNLGMVKANYRIGRSYSKTTIDLKNQDGIDFTKALVEKYISYFSGKVEHFNFGADEYANDVTRAYSWGWFQLQRTNNYNLFVEYVNHLATKIKEAKMTPMCFNDGIYYREDIAKSSGTFDKDIVIMYWTAGWDASPDGKTGAYVPASAEYLSKEGHKLLNLNDNWYYIVGKEQNGSGVYSFADALHGVKHHKFNSIAARPDQNKNVETIGSVLGVWCDDPFQTYRKEALFKLMDQFAANNPNEFSKAKIELPKKLPVKQDAIKAVSVDAGRKNFTIDQLKKIIDKISTKGYNTLHLALGNDGLRFILDDMAVTVDGTKYESTKVTEGVKKGNKEYANLKSSEYGEEYTQAQMDDLIKYAGDKHVSLIPVINSPGHMDSILVAMEYLGITNSNFKYRSSGVEKISKTTVDLKNEKAVKFTKELVRKYAKYFASKGIKYFNFGSDEYATDTFAGACWFHLQRNTKLYKATEYSDFVKYVNEMAAIVKAEKLKPICFNDGLYFSHKEFPSKFDKDIIVAYWTAGAGQVKTALPVDVKNFGHEILNFNENWYYVIGNEDSGIYKFDDAKKKTKDIKFDEVNGAIEPVESIGSVLSLWADNPSKEYKEDNFFTLIDNFADSNPEHFVTTKPADFSKLDEVISNTSEHLKRKDDYTPESYQVLFDAMAKDNEDLRKLTDKDQGKVDAVTEEITKAIAGLKLKKASYTEVEKAVKDAKKELENKAIYTEDSLKALETAVNAVDYTKDIKHQAEVDAYVTNIRAAIANLKVKPADLSSLEDAIEKVKHVEAKKDLYTKESLEKVTKAVEKAKEESKNFTAKDQDKLAELVKAINEAIKELEFKPANYDKVDEAVNKIPEDLEKYTDESLERLNKLIKLITPRNKKANEQALVDSYAKQIEDAIAQLVEKDLDYKMLEGANQKVELGKTAKFRSEADYKKFTKVFVDDKELAAKDYVVSKGSTIVELTAEFIKTLKPGMHTIKIQSIDGKSITQFEVVAKPVIIDTNKPAKPNMKENKPSEKPMVKPEVKKGNNPKTGDEVNTFTIFGLMVMGLASLVVLKKKFN